MKLEQEKLRHDEHGEVRHRPTELAGRETGREVRWQQRQGKRVHVDRQIGNERCRRFPKPPYRGGCPQPEIISAPAL